MSLINKMLRDLDARNAVPGKAQPAGELRPLPEANGGERPRFGPGMIAFLVVAALAFIALQFSDLWLPQLKAQLRDKPVAAAPQPVAPPPAPAPTVIAAAATPPVVAPAAAPDVAPPSALVDSLLPLPSLGDALMAHAEAAAELRPGLKLDTELAREPAPPAAPPAAAPAPTASRSKPAAARAQAGIVIDKKDPLAGDHAEAEYRKGVAAYRAGHASEAAAAFRAVLAEDPRHLGARQALLGMLAQAKQWDEAQALLKEALTIMPTHYLWAMVLARIQVERGNTAAALETLLQHKAYADKRADYQGFTGAVLQRLQRPREAALCFQAAAQLRPSEARWWLGLGMSLEADARPAEAREAFLKAQGADGLTPETQAFIAARLRKPPAQN